MPNQNVTCRAVLHRYDIFYEYLYSYIHTMWRKIAYESVERVKHLDTTQFAISNTHYGRNGPVRQKKLIFSKCSNYKLLKKVFGEVFGFMRKIVHEVKIILSKVRF